MSKAKSQCERLAAHFRRGRSITHHQAVAEMHIAAFHRRLTDLKKKEWLITSQWVGTGQGRYKRYKGIAPSAVKVAA